MTNTNSFSTNPRWVSKSAEFNADIKFVGLVKKNAPTVSYRQKNGKL
jgi:hypothetical protein